MRPIILSLFLILSYSYSATTQSNWINYTRNQQMLDVLVDGDDVWTGSVRGLTKTNLQTGEFQTYLSENSPIKGAGISKIEKDPNGSLWFVSVNAGLFNLMNGEWIHYYHDIITNASIKIYDFQILPNGDVWFRKTRDTYYDHELYRIRDGSLQTFKNFPEGSRSFCVNDAETIYISYFDEIIKYDVQQNLVVEIFNTANSIINTNDEFSKIYFDKNGALIIPSPNRILQIKDGDLSVLADEAFRLRNSFKDTQGNIYLQYNYSEQKHLRLLKFDGSVFTTYRHNEFEPYPSDAVPTFFEVDGEGNFYAWIQSINTNEGLYRLEGNDWVPIKSQIPEALQYIQQDVQADCEGNLWFASLRGIDVKYIDGSWENFSIDIVLNRTFNAGNMTVDPITCDVWFANIGNNGGPSIPGIIKISDGVVTEFLDGYDNVYDIEASADGKIYFSGGLGKIGYIENDEVHFIHEFDEDEFISSIDIDSEGNLYLVGWYLGLVKYDGEDFFYYGLANEINYSYDVFVDNDDLVWIITDNGLYQHDGLNWINYNNAWPETTSITGIVQNNNGKYWVSTFGEGMFYWDKVGVQKYNILNSGINSNLIYAASLDPFGNLIATTNIGASILNIPKTENNYRGTGKVFFDLNKNGVYEEASDLIAPGQKIKDQDSGNWTFTNSNGAYVYYSSSWSDHTFTHNLESNAQATTDNPQNGTIHNNQGILPYFGFWKAPEPHVDISIFNSVPVCNNSFLLQINLTNKDFLPIVGQLTLNYNPNFELIESSLPITQQTSGSITFEEIELKFLAKKEIKLTFEAPGITVPAASLFFDVIFENEDHQFNATMRDEVLCSYDPNDKKVEPTGEYFENYSLIEDALKYTIRFQNEGTYKAFDIVIIDTLDSKLDQSTFQFLGSSHRVETSVTTNGVVSFTFSDINLPPKEEDEIGSQGFVSFKIKANKNIENNTEILNNASIYFDFNPPIVTNSTASILVDDLRFLSTEQLEKNISVYPNPSYGNINIEIDEAAAYQILNITGQLVGNGKLAAGKNLVNLNATPGIYFLRISNKFDRASSYKLIII